MSLMEVNLNFQHTVYQEKFQVEKRNFNKQIAFPLKRV